jgi:hypothetical protein
MTTRAALKAEILDDLERSLAADGTRVLSAISSAIKFYQPKRFFFNESRSVTFNTVASTDTYSFATIGTEFYRVDGVFITISADDVRELCRTDYTLMEASDTATGEPSEYAYIDKSIRLWRSPDDAYSTRLVGHIKLDEPSADAETGNDWFGEAYELIRCRAKAYLYAHVYGDANMAMVMRAAEQDALSALRGATFDKVETGRLEPTEF